MATVNVYLPDEMKARLDGSDLNLSAIARGCWERELEMAELETEEIRVDAVDEDGDVELRFTGTLLLTAGYDGTEMYLTDEDEVLIVDDERRWTSTPRNEIDADDLGVVFRDKEDYAAACAALGLRRVIQL